MQLPQAESHAACWPASLWRMHVHRRGRHPTCGRCCMVHSTSLGIQAAPFGPVQQHSLRRREQQHAVRLAVLAAEQRICLHRNH